MSRLGKQPIAIPSGVEASFTDGVLTIKCPNGTLTRTMKDDVIAIEVRDGEIGVAPQDPKNNHAHALWGTYGSHIRNMITGVTEGFTKVLEIEGVGYRAEVRGDTLVLNVGYSHPVELSIPESVNVQVEKGVVTLTGSNKEELGQFAANARATRPPEPYNGKGIHYQGEYIIRKQGKKAA